jgi:hypothetical protein
MAEPTLLEKIKAAIKLLSPPEPERAPDGREILKAAVEAALAEESYRRRQIAAITAKRKIIHG